MRKLSLAVHGTTHQRVELEQEALYQAFPNSLYWSIKAGAVTKQLLATLDDAGVDELQTYIDSLPDDITEFGMWEALTKWQETRTQAVAVNWTSSTTADVEVR